MIKTFSGNGDIHCDCGNTPCSEGFYPCNRKGQYVEPTPGWEGYYKCDRCGQLFLYEGAKE